MQGFKQCHRTCHFSLPLSSACFCAFYVLNHSVELSQLATAVGKRVSFLIMPSEVSELSLSSLAWVTCPSLNHCWDHGLVDSGWPGLGHMILPITKTRGGRKVTLQGKSGAITKRREEVPDKEEYQIPAMREKRTAQLMCAGHWQSPMYLSYCSESSGEIVVVMLERRTLWPERLVPCEFHPTAGLALEPSAWALSPVPKPWARPKPYIGTILIKKLDLCLKMQTLCSEVDSNKPIRSATEFLYRRDRTLKIVNKGFLGGTVVKNPPANAGDMGSSPGPGRSHMPQSN